MFIVGRWRSATDLRQAENRRFRALDDFHKKFGKAQERLSFGDGRTQLAMGVKAVSIRRDNQAVDETY
jgi:hypothetical protein